HQRGQRMRAGKRAVDAAEATCFEHADPGGARWLDEAGDQRSAPPRAERLASALAIAGEGMDWTVPVTRAWPPGLHLARRRRRELEGAECACAGWLRRLAKFLVESLPPVLVGQSASNQDVAPVCRCKVDCLPETAHVTAREQDDCCLDALAGEHALVVSS